MEGKNQKAGKIFILPALCYNWILVKQFEEIGTTFVWERDDYEKQQSKHCEAVACNNYLFSFIGFLFSRKPTYEMVYGITV